MEFITEPNRYVIKYSSILDMMESVREPHWVNKADMPSHLDYNSQSWLGCSSYNEVDRLTTEGWREGLVKMEDAIGRLELSRAMDIRRKKKWGASGSAINIHKVYAGKCHKAWMKMKRQVMIRIRKVTMYVDICANCGKTAEVMFWKGAAATILADALELAGYSVRIIGYMRSTGSFREGYREIEQYVTLKEYGATIDKTVLATGTGLAGFFRKYFFQGMGLCPERLTCSLGSHGYIHNFEKEFDELVVKLDDIWSLTDAKRAVDRVINQLQEENIKVV